MAPGRPAHRARGARGGPGRPGGGEWPDYNESRARHEWEKANLAELERRQKADELVYREDVEQAQRAVALALCEQLEALPQQIGQQLPHLTVADMELVEKLVDRLRERVADWRMAPEEEE